HRAGRGAGESLRPGRDGGDAGGRGALSRARAAGERGAEPRRRPHVLWRRQLRPRALPAGRRAVRRVLVAALVLALAAPVLAQPKDDEVRRTRLANGLTVIVRRSDVAPVVAVSLLVRMGTRWETPETAGLSNFAHAVMVKGTARRSGSQLAETVAGFGGKLSASGEADYSE